MNNIRPCGNNEKWCECCVSKGKCNYTKNQSIIAEIEKLKAKIEEKCSILHISLLTTEEVFEVLDNRIAELKGE